MGSISCCYTGLQLLNTATTSKKIEGVGHTAHRHTRNSTTSDEQHGLQLHAKIVAEPLKTNTHLQLAEAGRAHISCPGAPEVSESDLAEKRTFMQRDDVVLLFFMRHIHSHSASRYEEHALSLTQQYAVGSSSSSSGSAVSTCSKSSECNACRSNSRAHSTHHTSTRSCTTTAAVAV
jgi:hypothetical protein